VDSMPFQFSYQQPRAYACQIKIKSNQIRFISGNMAHKSYKLVQKL